MPSRMYLRGRLPVAFSPKGQRLTAGEYALKLWDVTTGSKDMSHQFVSPAATCLAFSPDGKHLAIDHFRWPVGAVGQRHRAPTPHLQGARRPGRELGFQPRRQESGFGGRRRHPQDVGNDRRVRGHSDDPGGNHHARGGLWLSHDGQKAVTGFQSKTIPGLGRRDRETAMPPSSMSTGSRIWTPPLMGNGWLWPTPARTSNSGTWTPAGQFGHSGPRGSDHRSRDQP